MRLILPLFLLFVLWLRYEFKKSQQKTANQSAAFWTREHEANSTRKKNIDDLHYITIPVDSLPFIATNNNEIIKQQEIIKTLAERHILNLTGISNTDLKYEYGTANFTRLSEYDNNFSNLAQAVAKLGELLMNDGYTQEAVAFLEFGIECNTDISSNYTLLAKYYIDNSQIEKVSYLLQKANSLNSLMRDPIIAKLESFTITR